MSYYSWQPGKPGPAHKQDIQRADPDSKDLQAVRDILTDSFGSTEEMQIADICSILARRIREDDKASNVDRWKAGKLATNAIRLKHQAMKARRRNK
jgi:hypothetical protein